MNAHSIEDRFVRLFRRDLGVTIVKVERHDWPAFATELRFRFGYAPPTFDPDPVVTFSPDLIAAVTEPLSANESDIYVMGIEALVAGHLMHPDWSPDQTATWIENQLATQAPGCLRVMTTAEMQAIDSGVVSI